MIDVISSGVNGTLFDLRYNNLKDNREAIFNDLMRTIEVIIGNIPNGVLIIFPSYKMLNDFEYLIRTETNELSNFKDFYF